MVAAGRRRPPVEVRLAAIELFAIGGVLSILSLMAAGVLLSGPQIDPARTGTGYLDFVLFFNAVLCVLPFDVLTIVLGYRLLRGDRWAWTTSLVLCGFVALVAPTLTYLLPAPTPFGVVPVACAVVLCVLLVLPRARLWVRQP
jgi:hypothetical protein